MHRLPSGRSAPAPRIMLVDHDELARDALKVRLTLDGYQVVTCAHAAEALLELDRTVAPDLILLELATPVMDGWQFRVEQRRNPRLSGIPILAFSEDGSAQAQAIDAEAFLRKPFDYPALRETVERLLSSFERKRAQSRQLELGRLSVLGTLAGGVAHEINNPLTFVSGNLTFAVDQLRRALEADTLESSRAVLVSAKKALSEAVVGANRIEHVVRGLAAFARPGSSETEPLDVCEALETAIQMTQNEVRHRAHLVRDYAELPRVVGSRARVGQVFVNLLLNAAQAIPEGRAQDNEIRISAQVKQGFVVVEIKDSGRGIAPEMLGHIYEPFFTTKPVGVGMGLGLSICHAAVQALEGSIEVESELGQGSTFRVSLPMAGDQTPLTSAKTPPLSASNPRRGHVLVIDDEPLICTLLVSLLSPHHEVTGLSSAREAMRRIVEGARFDLIMCDLMMPDMTGMDFYAALSRDAPEQLENVVFLTGGAFTESSRRFLESISNPQLAKPFSLPEVLELARERIQS